MTDVELAPASTLGLAQLAEGARGESLGFLNVPHGHVASAALRRLGGRLDGAQLEMVRVL